MIVLPGEVGLRRLVEPDRLSRRGMNEVPLDAVPLAALVEEDPVIGGPPVSELTSVDVMDVIAPENRSRLEASAPSACLRSAISFFSRSLAVLYKKSVTTVASLIVFL